MRAYPNLLLCLSVWFGCQRRTDVGTRPSSRGGLGTVGPACKLPHRVGYSGMVCLVSCSIGSSLGSADRVRPLQVPQQYQRERPPCSEGKCLCTAFGFELIAHVLLTRVLSHSRWVCRFHQRRLFLFQCQSALLHWMQLTTTFKCRLLGTFMQRQRKPKAPFRGCLAGPDGQNMSMTMLV